jgi:hypothetical protein
MAAGSWLEGALSLRFLQEPALSLSKGRVAMLADATLSVLHNTRCVCGRDSRLRQEREGRGTSQIKGWAARPPGF